jgi:hypothetical protein
MSDVTAVEQCVARVRSPFAGVPDGLVMPKNFAEGEEVRGDLARVAVAQGWAEPVSGFAAKLKPAETPPRPPEPVALDTLKKTELVELAKGELDLVLDPDSKKDAMIAAIEAARAAKAAAAAKSSAN